MPAINRYGVGHNHLRMKIRVQYKGGNMKRRLASILAIMLLLTCSGCIWWDHDREGYDDRDRGGYERHEGHEGHGEHDEHR